jgi:hypothetical protein
VKRIHGKHNFSLAVCRKWNEIAPHPAEVAPTLTVKESEPELAISFAHLVCVWLAADWGFSWSTLFTAQVALVKWQRYHQCIIHRTFMHV